MDIVSVFSNFTQYICPRKEWTAQQWCQTRSEWYKAHLSVSLRISQDSRSYSWWVSECVKADITRLKVLSWWVSWVCHYRYHTTQGPTDGECLSASLNHIYSIQLKVLLMVSVWMCHHITYISYDSRTYSWWVSECVTISHIYHTTQGPTHGECLSVSPYHIYITWLKVLPWWVSEYVKADITRLKVLSWWVSERHHGYHTTQGPTHSVSPWISHRYQGLTHGDECLSVSPWISLRYHTTQGPSHGVC